MDAICMSGDRLCHVHALAAALHSLILYCTVISAALICCCSTSRSNWSGTRWRYQNVRGIASLALGVIWCCGGAAASLRPADTVSLVAALMPPLAWLSAATLHVSLWTRRSSAPILYLAIYWLLSAASSASILYQLVQVENASKNIEFYIHGASMLLTSIIAVIDCICFYDEMSPDKTKGFNIWECYARMVWPNFYIAGILKLFGDLTGIVPAIGIAVIIQYIENPNTPYNSNTHVTIDEFTSNGFVMLLIISLALIVQALLSQNSTHLVTVEGTRLKMALQSVIYDKCMKLASWSVNPEVEEETPLLHNPEQEANTQSGLLMNLISQDTYNVSVILYLLYARLGLSAIIGTACSLLIVTPLQFYIGKKIASFTTQISAVLVTVVTFTTHYILEDSSTLTATKVFSGLVLFNQLTIPLLILPVTILMIIQAMVSTNRIKDFLELPEAFNVPDDNIHSDSYDMHSEKTTDDFLDNPLSEREEFEEEVDDRSKENKEIIQSEDILISFKNAAFSWRMKDNAWLEIDELDIPLGKLIMVVGSSGSGKSSLLSAILGEMYRERGDVKISEKCSMWYSGQPPWLLEGSIRDNVLMGGTWSAIRYNRVMRATGLRPDLQLLPDGDNTQLGMSGAPLSGGQRVRLSVARALYSRSRLIVLDEPLGALDVPLARHLVVRALLPAARAGRTIILATNRLELLHYADLVIVMEDGRVSVCGRVSSSCNGAIKQWAQLAAEARESASRGSQGPTGGAARERSHLMRAVSRTQFQMHISEESMPQVGINEVAGAHLLTEVPTCAGGSWRNTQAGLMQLKSRIRPALPRQFSTPSPDMPRAKWLRDVRRAASVDASNEALQQEASLIRRVLPSRPYRTLYSRWTPWSLRRFISTDSDKEIQHSHQNSNNGPVEVPDLTLTSVTSNGIETSATIPDLPLTNKEQEPVLHESAVWWQYCRACGWWGAVYVVAATLTQGVAMTADWWLTRLTDSNNRNPLSDKQVWDMILTYSLWCAGGVLLAGFAQVACACAGASPVASFTRDSFTLHYTPRCTIITHTPPETHYTASPLTL
ncbi:unnamed protein product [Danaus chrysippus]|uniref:(African queen) hypothetical protein n=1 Tax=Danaus chrysippus TaxID=151541 RepID=A0A8J2R8T4_9NEOP|nr:unnamed protein product [Danaus chrysippus]